MGPPWPHLALPLTRTRWASWPWLWPRLASSGVARSGKLLIRLHLIAFGCIRLHSLSPARGRDASLGVDRNDIYEQCSSQRGYGVRGSCRWFGVGEPEQGCEVPAKGDPLHTPASVRSALTRCLAWGFHSHLRREGRIDLQTGGFGLAWHSSVSALGDYVVTNEPWCVFKQGIPFLEQVVKILDFCWHIPSVESIFFKEPAIESTFDVSRIRSS